MTDLGPLIVCASIFLSSMVVLFYRFIAPKQGKSVEEERPKTAQEEEISEDFVKNGALQT